MERKAKNPEHKRIKSPSSAQQRAQETRDYFENLIAIMPGHVYWLDRKGVYLGCNDQQAYSAGLKSRKEIVGKINAELPWNYHANTLPEALDRINQEVMESGIPRVLEEPGILPDGTKAVFLSNKIPLKDQRGEIIGLVGISVDITENKKLQEKLVHAKAREARFKAIAEMRDYFENLIAVMPGHVYWLDRKGVYLGCNDQQAHSIGLRSRKEIVGKMTAELPWNDHADTLPETLDRINREVMESGVPRVLEEPGIFPDGTKAVFLSNKIPFKDARGKIIGLVGISMDITENKKLQKELALSKAREARFKAMSALGGMIAHELRTPLAALKGTAVAIQKALPKLIRGYQLGLATGQVEEPLREDLFEALQQSIADMGQRVDYAQATISTILTGFHYASSPEILETRPLSLPPVVQKAIEQYPFTAAQKAWVTVHPLDMTEVIGEEQIIIHVLHNLIKNALYAIASVDKGGVTIRSAVKKDRYCLYVEDTAKGIPAEQLPRIFEAFYTTKAKGAESIGLGLYFCKMALKRMQADIQCESEVGKYARFTITIPLSRAGQRVGR